MAYLNLDFNRYIRRIDKSHEPIDVPFHLSKIKGGSNWLWFNFVFIFQILWIKVALEPGFRNFVVLQIQNTDLDWGGFVPFFAIHILMNLFYFILAYQVIAEVADFIKGSGFTVKGSAYQDIKDKVEFRLIPPYFTLGKLILHDEEKQETQNRWEYASGQLWRPGLCKPKSCTYPPWLVWFWFTR